MRSSSASWHGARGIRAGSADLGRRSPRYARTPSLGHSRAARPGDAAEPQAAPRPVPLGRGRARQPAPRPRRRASDDGAFSRRAREAGEGAVSSETTFHYRGAADMVSATYSGGRIWRGFLVGTRAGDVLDFRYAQLHLDGTTASGHCRTMIAELRRGVCACLRPGRGSRGKAAAAASSGGARVGRVGVARTRRPSRTWARLEGKSI